MKHIIILEGIATSGKTSVKNELEKILVQRGLSFTFIGEEETLMPLLHNTDAKIANDHIVNLSNKYLVLDTDVLIFDRLYLTHMWRTGSHEEDFSESASLLLQHSAQICFLEIPSNKLEERITFAQSHRDEKWNAYVSTKGKTQQEILAYYAGQQKELLELLKRVSIPHTIFDTGDMDFGNIAGKICSLQKLHTL
jgi:thymidylate kinase